MGFFVKWNYYLNADYDLILNISAGKVIMYSRKEATEKGISGIFTLNLWGI
jgi:hypothetical protein